MALTLQGVGLAGRELRTHRLAEVEQPMRHALLILSRQAGSRGVTLVNELELLPPLALHSSSPVLSRQTQAIVETYPRPKGLTHNCPSMN
jgi:hypothetical protein